MGLSIHTADFLHGLFVDRPPRIIDPVVELVSDKKPNASEAATHTPTVAVEPEVVESRYAAANAVGEGVADYTNNAPVVSDEFADWILRPDLDGRLGWEPPYLPELARWWSRIRF